MLNMSSRKKKGEGKTGESWEKSEEILQAVVLADSFNYKFLPITRERPRVLLPLLNYPLLDYTITFLVEAGVQEISVFCCAHADQIKAHLSQSKWSSERCPCEINTIVSEDCRSVGDALREIDRQSLIRSDFVLVSGDIVSNMKLDKVLEEHRTRRKKDKSSVMTMVFKVANPRHRTRCHEEELLLAVETSSNRILHCEKPNKNKKFIFPLSLFSGKPSIQLRYDLLDCNISICSPQVCQLFTDNFDYQTRDDFVRGILVNEEIMGNQIHCHMISDKYAARVSNFSMFDAVSKDIMDRWAYPIVPDNSVFSSQDCYSYSRHNVYLDRDVLLARDCVLEENLVIGRGTSVGTGTVITNSVIGKNCCIGDNVRIDGAHLWDKVVVENGCSISKSVLCNNVHIKRDVTVREGSLVSFDVIIGPDIVLPPCARVSLKSQEDEDEDFGMDELSLDDETRVKKTEAAFCTDSIGAEGRGYLWEEQADSDEEMDVARDTWGIERVSSSEDDTSSISSEDSGPPPSPPAEDARLFYNEVLESIRHGVTDKVSPDNIILEINASKYAYNVTFRELNQSVIKALLETTLSDVSLPRQEHSKIISKALDHVQPLLRNYIKDPDNQIEALTAAEEYFVYNQRASSLLQVFLHQLYDRDILDETVILRWYSKPPATDDVTMETRYTQLRQQISRFITWLQEAEEESEDDEDDDN